MLRVERLAKSFGAIRALHDVSFAVERGSITVFTGADGSGKSTLFKILVGLVQRDAGRIFWKDGEIGDDFSRLVGEAGYMPERFSLYTDLTVEENLRFWGGAYGLFGAALRARAEWAIRTAGLGAERSALVRDLPSGFRQRLALGAALLHEPPVVFLDEPTGGVDPEARRRFWDLIDELAAAGKTVFVTTHSMDEAERCHRVALMHAGRLLALDTVPALKASIPPGRLVEVSCPRPAQALAVLEAIAGVGEAALFGDRLHALLADPSLTAAIGERLGATGFTPVTVAVIAQSLEDAFIHIISRAEAASGLRVRGSGLVPPPAPGATATHEARVPSPEPRPGGAP